MLFFLINQNNINTNAMIRTGGYMYVNKDNITGRYK